MLRFFALPWYDTIRNVGRFSMKHDDLRSIAHDISESAAGGCGLMIGFYQMDIFGEAKRSAEGFIEVDFLNGTTHGGKPSPSLSNAVRLYNEALPRLCEKHGTTVSCFRQLTARYSPDPHLGGLFTITIEDARGHRSTTEYAGVPGRRVKTLDHLGRLRPKPPIKQMSGAGPVGMTNE